MSTHIDPLMESARAIAERATGNAFKLDQDGAFPADEIGEMRDLGLLRAPFPPDLGGRDLGSPPGDSKLLFKVLATIGQGSLPLGRLYEGHVNAVKLVRLYGSKENLRLLAEEAEAGRLTGVWMAEDGAPLKLREDHDERVLEGRKVLASGAGHIRRPLIAAASEAGSVLLLPDAADPSRVDVSGWTAAGMKATATGSVDFTGLRIGAAERVGQPGDYMRSPYFRGGAWRVMAVQYGGLRALHEAYRARVAGMGRDGDRLQRARFGEATSALETARLWIEEACARAEDRALEPEAIDAYVDLMRGTFERAALMVLERARKSIGLKAFMRPDPIERIARDLETYLRQPALDASLESAAAFFFQRPGLE